MNEMLTDEQIFDGWGTYWQSEYQEVEDFSTFCVYRDAKGQEISMSDLKGGKSFEDPIDLPAGKACPQACSSS